MARDPICAKKLNASDDATSHQPMGLLNCRKSASWISYHISIWMWGHNKTMEFYPNNVRSCWGMYEGQGVSSNLNSFFILHTLQKCSKLQNLVYRKAGQRRIARLRWLCNRGREGTGGRWLLLSSRGWPLGCLLPRAEEKSIKILVFPRLRLCAGAYPNVGLYRDRKEGQLISTKAHFSL